MKIRHVTMLGFLALTIGVCANTNPIRLSKEEKEVMTQFSDDPRGEYIGVKNASDDPIVIPDTLTIRYQMDPPTNYDNLRFYVWAGGADGVELEADGVDDFGMYITLNPKEDYPPHEILYFIIKVQNTWAGQSTDTVIDYSKFTPDENGHLDIWAIDGNGANIDIFATQEETLGDKITYAKFTDWKTIHVEGTGPISSYRVYALTPGYYNLGLTEQTSKYDDYMIASGDVLEKTNEIDIHFEYHMPPSVVYQIEITFTNYKDRPKTRPADFDLLYGTDRFEKYYTYDGQLGPIYTKEKTTFRLWAPMAARVELRLYYMGTPGYLDENGSYINDSYRVYRMNYMPGGVWSCEVEEDLNGTYYTYNVYNTSGQNEVVDPYVKAAGVNGERGMVLDFDTTDPEGWDDIPLVWDGDPVYDLAKPTDLAVYEIHIRDLTMDDTWNGESTPGTYQAFIEEGTTYTKDNITVTTGFDHIEELGVNAIQILPVFDQSNNEVEMSFNWGYNPLNYNVVEGGYSSDPFDGAVRVKEFKQLVQAFANNDNHTRVIMDVVYNHVSSATSSNFQKIMPNYYFRMTDDGYYKNGAGCGNEVKTEATMMSKFIVDSVTWWASEYKIKGFRFDLMGLIDTGTMRKVKDALYEIDPDFVVYGEGWTSGGYGGEEGTKGTDSSVVYTDLYASSDSPGHLGGFNDGGRNAVRGGNDQGYGTNNPYPGWGFIAQGFDGTNAGNVAAMLRGTNPYAGGANPYQTVNYVSCHDNYTLFDQLNYTLAEHTSETTSNPPASVEPNPLDVAKASLASHAAVAFSQGITFIQGGEELFRSKEVNPENESYEVRPYPDYPSYSEDPEVEVSTNEVRMYGKIITHNSYRNSDETNSFKYDRKISIEYQGQDVNVYDVYKGFVEMFKIRKTFSDARLSYDSDSESPFNSFSSWDNHEFATDNNPGATMLGLYFATGNNHTGTKYYLFFAGRLDSTLSWDQAGQGTLIYNSASPNGLTSEGISLGNKTISLGARQFVVYAIGG